MQPTEFFDLVLFIWNGEFLKIMVTNVYLNVYLTNVYLNTN